MHMYAKEVSGTNQPINKKKTKSKNDWYRKHGTCS